MATRSTKSTSKAKTKTTAAKPAMATATKVTAKPATATPKATVVEQVKPVVSGATVKKPELIDRVIAETGMKKKDVKPVVEAMLAVLGRTLAEGEELNVPPLGKVMVKNTKDLAKATILNIKVRHPNTVGQPAKDPLAEPAE